MRTGVICAVRDISSPETSSDISRRRKTRSGKRKKTRSRRGPIDRLLFLLHPRIGAQYPSPWLVGKIEKETKVSTAMPATSALPGGGLRRARVVSDRSRAQDPGGEFLLYCPCAEGLTGRALLALCLLPIHDANGRLLEALGRLPVARRVVTPGYSPSIPFAVARTSSPRFV